MKILFFYITRTDFKKETSQLCDTVFSLRQTIDWQREHLVSAEETNMKLHENEQHLVGENRTLTGLLESKHKENTALKRSLRRLCKKLHAGEGNIRRYETALSEMQSSYEELYEDYLKIAKKMEKFDDTAEELAWYKAAVARCKKKLKASNTISPSKILNDLMADIKRYGK